MSFVCMKSGKLFIRSVVRAVMFEVHILIILFSLVLVVIIIWGVKVGLPIRS